MRTKTSTDRKPTSRRYLLSALGLLATASLAGGCGDETDTAEPDTFDQAAIQSDMDALVADGVPGVVVAVAQGDQTTTLTSGVSDLEADTPVESDDRFRIGSLAKPYVGTVVMQLVEDGTLSLDDTVEEWLPGVVPNGAEITIAQLLRHQSGIANYEGPEVLRPYLKGDQSYVWTPDELVDVALEQGSQFDPGTAVEYSNTNYILAGKIIEAATGHSLEEELESRIFEPLQLDDTTFSTEGPIEEPYAHGYLLGNGKPIDATEVYPFYWGAGNIVADIDDVTRFYSALFGGDLVSDESLEQMKDTVAENPSHGQGLGIVDGEFPVCGHYYGHDGSSPGYFAAAYEFDSGRQFVFLANSVSLEDTIGNPEAQESLTRLLQTACS